eukprot:jgi/Bigna1/144898/aug1.92_g19606
MAATPASTHSRDRDKVKHRSSQYGYVSLLTNDGFLPGAIVLAKSLLKVEARYPLAVMVTSGVSQESRQKLAKLGVETIPIEPLPCPNGNSSHVKSWEAVGLTKLRVWQLGDYFAKVVYIDADAIVVRNVDHLFKMIPTTTTTTAASASASAMDSPPLYPFAAAPDIFPPDRFNAGVLVLSPNSVMFAYILRLAAYGLGAIVLIVGSYDGGDTGFLNRIFPRWYWEWSVVPNLHIIHYASSPKPWEVPAEDNRRTDKLEKIWWKIQQEDLSPHSISSLRDYQVTGLNKKEGKIERAGRGTPRAERMEMKANEEVLNNNRPSTQQKITNEEILNNNRPSTQETPNTGNNGKADGEHHNQLYLASSFESSMCMQQRKKLRYGLWSSEDRKWLQSLKICYDKWCCHQRRVLIEKDDDRTMESTKRMIIPKIIHQIWFGSNPLPENFETRFQETWKGTHPHWR